MLRQSLSRDERVRDTVMNAPGAPELVSRFVAGSTTDEVVAVAADLIGKGLDVIVDLLGEDSSREADQDQVVAEYLRILDALAAAGLAGRGEVSVKLSALGLVGGQGVVEATRRARTICEAAASVGSAVTLDMEEHTAVDDTLAVAADLRRDHPDLGVVLQAYLRRTEDDCRALTGAGSRVRICKGAYQRVPGVGFTDSHAIDRSYVRCLRVLMEGDGYPMVATHDPRLIAIAEKLARTTGRTRSSFEFQMLYGIRPVEQRRLVDIGYRSRVYLPYGTQWYEYFVRRVAERPATVGLFGRTLFSRR